MSAVYKVPKKENGMKTLAQCPAGSLVFSVVRTPGPRRMSLALNKSITSEPQALLKKKMLIKRQEIRIVREGDGSQDGCRDTAMPGGSLQEEEAPAQSWLHSRDFRDVGTQTNPTFIFSSLEEILQFVNSSPGGADQENADADGGVCNATEAQRRSLKLEIIEDLVDQLPIGIHLYPKPTERDLSLCTPNFPIIKRRRKQRFHCDWRGPIATISSPNVPTNAAELRVDEELALSIRQQVDLNNPGPFGWQLAKLLYTEEELYGHNFNGADQKRPLSPRRVHAIQHAFHDYFPKDMADDALGKGRTAINQGIRNMFYIRNRRDGD